MACRLPERFCLLALGVLSLLATASGCTATRLRHRTSNFGSTLPDLQYH